MDFLKSTRFWKLVGAAVVWGLMMGGILPREVAEPIIALLTASVVVRTIDRTAENIGSKD
jgi:hypothetical protein